MRKIFHLIVLGLFLFGASSSARAYPGFTCDLGTLIDGIALNTGTATDLVIDIPASATCSTGRRFVTARAHKLVLIFDYTNSSGSTLVATHLVGLSTATATPGECSSTSGGTCTSGTSGITSMAVTGDIIRSHRYNIRGYPVHKITMSMAGADGSDLLTVTGFLVE